MFQRTNRREAVSSSNPGHNCVPDTRRSTYLYRSPDYCTGGAPPGVFLPVPVLYGMRPHYFASQRVLLGSILHVVFATTRRAHEVIAADIVYGGLCFPSIAWIAKCVNDQPAGNDALAAGATSHTHRCAASRAARGWASDSPFAVALAWDHEWQRRSPTLASMYLGTCPCDCAHTHSCSLCCRFCASFGC